MRKISTWAKLHRRKAIIFLIAVKIILAFLAFFIGAAMQEINIDIPVFIPIIVLVVLMLSVITYPPGKSNRGNYARRKAYDLVIACSAFVMMTALVNKDLSLLLFRPISASTVPTSTDPTAEQILSSLQHRDKKTLTKKEKRVLKKEFKSQLKIYAKAKITGNKKDAGKALLIMLSIIAALGLLYLVAGLACSLSCNGAETAAVIVAIIGTAAVVIGLIFLIRRISKGPPKPKEYLPQTDT